MKYNKKLQKRLNININNYKEYSQLYSSIEIELKLSDNIYGEFINISDEEKEYYHIYFDNSIEEIKRNYVEYNDKVKMIKIIINYQVNSFKGLFKYCKCIKSVIFRKFYRNNVTDMSYMFRGCVSLKELNLSNFNTNNVTDMHYIFCQCKSLNELNLSNFNTNKVTDMSYMFCECIESIDFKLFYRINITNMKSMFNGCSSLKELNLSNFNTNNVTTVISEIASIKKYFFIIYLLSYTKLNIIN